MDNNLPVIDNKDFERAIEAILFAAGHPILYSKLAEVLDYTEHQIKKKIAAMAEKYNDKEKRGIMLLMFDKSCQLCTREEFLPYIKEVLGIKKGGNLSNSSLEVLAIIAYNEPVTRAFIDEVRDVDSAYIVTNLVEKDLIEICGRLDVPGRPYLYKTTPKFLRVFGIESLEQLPYVDLPRAKNDADIIPLDVDEILKESEDETPDQSTDENNNDDNNENETPTEIII